MAREIVLDTETTGLDPASGHRVIELACIELEDLIPTGRTFYRLIDPEREIDVDAERVHGISLASLRGKPKFSDIEVVEDFLEFVGDAALVAHNAAFDRNFVNAELERAGRGPLGASRWVDTLGLAQQRYPGMYNSLDALCRRFRISLAEREKHSALVDAKLLAGVYLELRGGRERGLDLGQAAVRRPLAEVTQAAAHGPRPRPLPPRSTEAERAAHAAFVRRVLKHDAVWLTLEFASVS
ncbi:MAG TPA: DNA polymerase III subunit epsilon [Caulobacteraceae bacterium]|nr:DNA polymerase III subunit epsilon [Caulobacteraceae bacterium]